MVPPPDQFFLEKMVPSDQNSMENWSIVGPKFSGEDQFSMKKLVPRTKTFVTVLLWTNFPWNFRSGGPFFSVKIGPGGPFFSGKIGPGRPFFSGKIGPGGPFFREFWSGGPFFSGNIGPGGPFFTGNIGPGPFSFRKKLSVRLILSWKNRFYQSFDILDFFILFNCRTTKLFDPD